MKVVVLDIINPEAIRFLNSVKGPIDVVTIVGPFRSGKSYLLGVLADHIAAF